ncbi:MAG: cytochrome c peroxidase [Bacteroidota bacterium]
MTSNNFLFLFAFILLAACSSCGEDEMPEPPNGGVGSLDTIPYNPVAHELNLPDHFPQMFIPPDNPLTVDGVQLGRRLFFDPILSRDGSMACAGCHFPDRAFTDGLAVSTGIDGIAGARSSMSLLNVGFFERGLFWDGRSPDLETQALLPVEDPIELHTTWPDVERKLREHPDYPTYFRKAFGISNTSEITKTLAAKAIAQYERSLVSFGSKFDQVEQKEAFYTDDEADGFLMFFDVSNGRLKDAECAHCHNAPLMTNDDFFNNGLTDVGDDLDKFPDKGLGGFTGRVIDYGKFRAPSLRNIALSAPYMHDGRFETLEEVLDHYSSGGHIAPNLDPNMRPLELTDVEKRQLLAFLHALTDTSYYDNPLFQDPFK